MKADICRTDECCRRVLAKGLCGLHYQRVRNTGTCDARKTATNEERFFNFVVFGEGCWGWKGAKSSNERPIFSIKHKNILAYRASWILFRGPIPAGLLVCHRCDNPECTNPDHLFLGTHSDNTRDMDAKGRRGTTLYRGEAHQSAKLTASDVLEIRRQLKIGVSQSHLGRKFNVRPQSISAIAQRKTWKHI